jgi:hypothetical protein
MVDDNFIFGTNPLILFYQNICGLRKKADELSSSVHSNLPHILCLSEHHLKQFRLYYVSLMLVLMVINLLPHIAEKLELCIIT